MPITKDYYFIPDKRRYKFKEAMDLICEYLDYTQLNWKADKDQMLYAIEKTGMCVNIADGNCIFQAVRTTDDYNNKVVAFMMSYKKTIPPEEGGLVHEAKYITKVVMMEDNIHVAKTISSEKGRELGEIVELPKDDKDFIKFLFKKRLTGKTGGFQVSAKPVYLRLDDASAVIKLLKEDTTETILRPLLLIHTEDHDLIHEVAQRFNQSFQILVLNDEELIEEMIDICTDDKARKKLNQILANESYTIISDQRISITSKKEDADHEDFYQSMIDEVTMIAENFTIFSSCDFIVYETMLTSRMMEEMEKMNDEREDISRKIDLAKKTIMDNKRNKNITAGSPFNIPAPVPPIGNGKYLKTGKEKDLYNGEIYDIIIDSLQEYRSKYVQDGTRRADILDSILAENKPLGVLDKKYEEVDKYFKNYEGNSPKALKDAERIGFKVKSKSNHLRLEWYGDPRYSITISSSPSEYLTNENAAALAKRTCL